MPTISGYPAVFNSLSERLGGGPYPFHERITPGAFTGTLANKDNVVALFNHDNNILLGRTSAGTLRLQQDKRGLFAQVDVPDTATVRDLVLEPIRRGDLNAWSFGFTINEGGQRWLQVDGEDIRELTSLTLYDVSPVVRPAYPGTLGIDLRGHKDARPNTALARYLPLHRERITTPAQLDRFILGRQQKFFVSIGGTHAH